MTLLSVVQCIQHFYRDSVTLFSAFIIIKISQKLNEFMLSLKEIRGKNISGMVEYTGGMVYLSEAFGLLKILMVQF